MKKKYYALFIIFMSLIIVALYFGFLRHFSLEYLQHNAQLLTQYAHDHPLLCVSIYIASYVITAFLPIPGEALLSIAGGFIYGPAIGIPLAILGTTLGATLAFLCTRFFFGAFVQQKFWREYDTMKDALSKHGPLILLSLRVIPTIPSSVVNYLSGILPVSMPAFLFTTALGVLPITSLYVMAGQKLTALTSISDALTTSWFLILFCRLGFLISLPIIIKMAKARTKAQN